MVEAAKAKGTYGMWQLSETLRSLLFLNNLLLESAQNFIEAGR